MSQTAKLERIAEAYAKLTIANKLMGEALAEVEEMAGIDGFCVTQDAPRVIRGFARQAANDHAGLGENMGCALACLRREVQQGKNLPT